MAKPLVLRELEAKHGSLHEIIPKLVNRGGQKCAADELGISAMTVSRWLKINGYKQRVVWEKEMKHDRG